LAESYPPLPPELIAFPQTGVSMLVGTCGADLTPETVRGVGIRISPDGYRMTVIVPASTGATAVAQLWHIGASTHPGPGLGAGSGYLVAKQLTRSPLVRRVLAKVPGRS
jgi:hypothetical protein